MNSQPSKPKLGDLGQAFLVGFVFETTLIAEMFGGPRDGWFFAHLCNLAAIVHYPAIIGEELWFWIYCLVLVLVWTFVFGLARRLLRILFARHGIQRRHKLVLGAAVGVIAIALVSWNFMDSLNDRPTPYTPSPDVKAIVEGNNAFALDLYQRLKTQPDNLFFSPYSISTGMGMIDAGARGLTEQELAKALHFTLPQTNLGAAVHDLADRLKRVQHANHITLLPANSLWVQRDYPLTQAFENLLRVDYHGEVRSVDFQHAPESAGEEIASWVEKKTAGRLKGAVKPGLVTSDTRVALCNAIYFKGTWARKFRRNQTADGPFHLATNRTVMVPVMNQTGEFKLAYADYHSLELLEIPYYGHDLSMVILLPEEVGGLPEVEEKLNAANLHDWLALLDGVEPHKTHVCLPRFTFTRSLNLVPELKGLGISSLFDNRANLSGMDGTTNLFISDVLHQAFVEVNEEGTEAAAMTLGIARTKGMDARFDANHPFIFLIRENATGSILFLGRLTDSTKP